MGLWKLRVDASGLRLDLFVRKDRCPGVLAVGSHVSGNVWLAADVAGGTEEGPGYIR